ncbi:NADP-dependent phosphogluconate dehydrogenase [Aquipuribacter nitratireducens]|uniref:6-phosphogluconate dehydrogenase, decarboxylating n=1 Tax=Aquipuribacter nitratireducens TaxID=650104 RepID=A0ABW0GPX0_9MICO
MSARADVGVVGLAVMGSNLARNLARHGHTVALYNRSPEKTRALVAEHGDEGEFVPSESLEDFVASLTTPRVVISMVQAGAGTDAVVDAVADLLEPGDMVVDGGNALFGDTIRRTQALAARKLHFVGAGVSGGEEGALNGPSIMVGGSEAAYETLGPIVESIAAQVDGTPCAAHLGTDGAGHFVKMVHNGIEYADMQLIGEAYDLLRHVVGLSPAEIADVFREWNTGELDSFLIEITAEVLAHVDGATGQPFADVVLDEAGMKGTGTWTVQTALSLGTPVSGIAEAVFARALSSHRETRDAVQAAFGVSSGSATPVPDDVPGFVEAVRRALYASKIVSYAQGFDMLSAGAAEHGWDLDMGTIARIWRGGCIIRARFLDRITDAYREHPGLVSLLTAPVFHEALDGAGDAWRDVVAAAVRAGVPVPGFSAALAAFDGARRDRLPAALVQGQRDLFGAHTYRRVDREGSFHVLWGEDRREVRA